MVRERFSVVSDVPPRADSCLARAQRAERHPGAKRGHSAAFRRHVIRQVRGRFVGCASTAIVLDGLDSEDVSLVWMRAVRSQVHHIPNMER